MIYAVILAGGRSERFSGEIPKQFVEIANKPILIWSLTTFSSVSSFARIIVVLPQEWLEYAKKLVESYLRDERLLFIKGGQTRTDSLMKALYFIDERFNIGEEDIAVTHDAARPFVTREHILSSIRLCEEFEAVTLAVSATDTVGLSSDGRVIKSLTDRNSTYLIQTPQTFKVRLFLRLYERLTPQEKAALTDASGVFILNDHPVAILQGDKRNIKITTKEDITLAEFIAQKHSY
ncbi:IspD/TarI family cytidylyltransferase [Pseudothermotoga sp.]|nr:2-C-methyl-D-erythritol 4-phosphate cytidylyltransferase [Pseudothermotoga sp.]MCX7813674.1 2-C-methyl-D-erythritol 4-phosphate cytidylyltransferase [Pseudothermotoga sp.]MDW8139479.1 2-C-methyl-D-erythritol 4-phosphate cytidylyltransferase [Pseudothermotoga sp.]